MASSDYTNIMKMKNTYNRPNHNCISHINHINCNDYPTRIIYNVDTSRYDTTSTTVRKYLITPIKGGAITFTINTQLKNFITSQIVSVYSDSNYFEGTINNYDQLTGEITINNIDYLNGTFSESSIYIVCLLGFNPELTKLKTKMKQLY